MMMKTMMMMEITAIVMVMTRSNNFNVPSNLLGSPEDEYGRGYAEEEDDDDDDEDDDDRDDNDGELGF